MQEYEFDYDVENPHEIRLIIKSATKLDGQKLYEALYRFVHEILEPALGSDETEVWH